ncbi:hypothetical protein EB74_28070 [Mycobacterium sp. SWH-M5]|nr:hypothetical protein EB74_28070 [Mycobacterium sp. SWH-M5]
MSPAFSSILSALRTVLLPAPDSAASVLTEGKQENRSSALLARRIRMSFIVGVPMSLSVAQSRAFQLIGR